MKRRSQPNIESPLEINLETKNEPKVVFVDSKLNQDLTNRMIYLLNDFTNEFAWTYEYMPSLHTDISASFTINTRV